MWILISICRKQCRCWVVRTTFFRSVGVLCSPIDMFLHPNLTYKEQIDSETLYRRWDSWEICHDRELAISLSQLWSGKVGSVSPWWLRNWSWLYICWLQGQDALKDIFSTVFVVFGSNMYLGWSFLVTLLSTHISLLGCIQTQGNVGKWKKKEGDTVSIKHFQ